MSDFIGDPNYTTLLYVLAVFLIFIGLLLLTRTGTNRSIRSKDNSGVIHSGDGNNIEQTINNLPSNDQPKPWWKQAGAFIAWLIPLAGFVLALLTYLSDKSP